MVRVQSSRGCSGRLSDFLGRKEALPHLFSIVHIWPVKFTHASSAWGQT